MGIKKKRKWTVFFLIKSVDGSMRQVISMMDEIMSLEFSDEIAVVFCVNTVQEHLPALLHTNAERVIEGLNSKAFTTVFLALEPAEGQDPPNKLVHVGTKDDFDLSIPEHISDYFRNNILNEYRAKRYLVFTWDHGSGFSIFRRVVEPIKMLEAAESSIAAIDPAEFINEITTTEEGNNFLTMEELAASFQLAFGEKRVDIVAMMNCHMQVIDTGFALRNTVKYIVASQMALDLHGFNYPFIFQMMIDEPKISPRKLARLIVSSYKTKVFPTSLLGKKSKGYCAMSAVDLFYFFNLEKFINKLAEFLVSRLSAHKAELLEARRQAIVNDGRSLVDIYTFVNTLEVTGQFANDTLLASLLLSMKDFVLFETHIGEEFQSGGKSSYRPTGLSIYFPQAVMSLGERPTAQKTAFFKKTRWKEFLINFQATALPTPAPSSA